MFPRLQKCRKASYQNQITATEPYTRIPRRNNSWMSSFQRQQLRNNKEYSKKVLGEPIRPVAHFQLLERFQEIMLQPAPENEEAKVKLSRRATKKKQSVEERKGNSLAGNKNARKKLLGVPLALVPLAQHLNLI